MRSTSLFGLGLVVLALAACSSSEDPAGNSNGSSGSSGNTGVNGGACLPDGTTLNVTNNGFTAYAIGGEFNPDFILCRGRTYTFAVNAPGHPFYIKTAATTGTGDAFSDGVKNNGAESGDVVFAVPASAPATLHYICSLHAPMTGQLTIVDP